MSLSCFFLFLVSSIHIYFFIFLFSLLSFPIPLPFFPFTLFYSNVTFPLALFTPLYSDITFLLFLFTPFYSPIPLPFSFSFLYIIFSSLFLFHCLPYFILTLPLHFPLYLIPLFLFPFSLLRSLTERLANTNPQPTPASYARPEEPRLRCQAQSARSNALRMNRGEVIKTVIGGKEDRGE